LRRLSSEVLAKDDTNYINFVNLLNCVASFGWQATLASRHANATDK